MRNPYFVLGVQADAEDSEIKRAYRRLAMAFHPDRNPDDFTAQERFAEINAAYEFLGDGIRRSQFDAGIIDAEGRRKPARVQPQGNPFTAMDIDRQSVEPGKDRTAQGMAERIFGEAFHRETPRDEPTTGSSTGVKEKIARKNVKDAPGLDDIPTDGGPTDRGPIDGGRHPARPRAFGIIDMALKPIFSFIAAREEEPRPADLELEATIPLADVIIGGQQTVIAPDGEPARLATDIGIVDGARIRLAGRGAESDGGERGDLIVTIRHERRPDLFSIGKDIHMALPLTLDEAVFGVTKEIEAPDGEAVSVTVPEWSDGAATIRVEGRGLPQADVARGDLVLMPRILLPEARDEKLVDLLRMERGDWFV